MGISMKRTNIGKQTEDVRRNDRSIGGRENGLLKAKSSQRNVSCAGGLRRREFEGGMVETPWSEQSE